MDKWIVAVAAGAGYISQHFKKHKQTGEQITSESKTDNSFSIKRDSPKQPPDKKWPFHRLLKSESLKLDDSQVKNEVSESSFGVLRDNERVRLSEDMVELPNKPLTPRSRMSLRSRRTITRAIRPLSSLESCVMAQLYDKNLEMKESFVSPSSKQQTVRPFLVTDGSNVINRASGGSFIVQNIATGKKLQPYSEDATLLVCLGMSFGILYSFMANKQEIEKLNLLLKQKENLVQDLEEEIEMKDSLIMQEVTIEDNKSQRMDGGTLNDVSHLYASREPNNKEFVVKKAKDDSFSKIEAELEAELETLELNMTSSTLERKISNLVELDPDFEPGVAEGELSADMITNNNQYERGTDTPESANYAVSPRELSLRLHEVLQSQLEERIKELEAEIESKQTLNNHKSWNDFSSSDAGDEKHVDEPVVLNLSGEALDAYNEACNEFAKLDESDEENACSTESGSREGLFLQYLEKEYDGSRNGGRTSGNEKDFDEDEMEKLLIKHIVEKARQGSPVVLNAQRVLFSE